MYIIVNDDLKMSKGKIASQVGHVVQIIIENIIGYYIDNKKNKESELYYDNYVKWKDGGSTKIVLKSNQQNIEKLIKLKGIEYIRDAGKTQIEPNSLTVIGFYPQSRNKINNIICNYKLL